MNELPLCARCGARLSAGSDLSQCPRCLLAFGIDGFPGDDSTSGVSDSHDRDANVNMGDYVLLEEIGRGGMGIVYQARQKSLDRLVAIKLILFGRWASPQQRRRFHSESVAAAALDHPNIVPIYEVGEHDGQPFYAMKLVSGESLAATPFKLNTKSIVRQVELLEKIARAVHFAHQHRVLHRDIKPTNILVEPNGVPYLTDFGLATMLEEESSITQSGAILGTPHYMAPEQLVRRTRDLTTAVDVYGLGAVIYERITGCPPFTGSTPVTVLVQVRDREPERPGRLNPVVDRNLESICLKCLNKEPERRYSSALELADDLGCWLAGLPTLARPVGPLERAKLWARRRPLTATLSGLIAMLVLGTAMISTIMTINLSHARNEARRLGDENQRRVVELSLSTAIDLVDESEHILALPWFAEALSRSGDAALNQNIRMLRDAALLRSPRLEKMWFHDAPASQVRFSPDGRFIAIGFGNRVRVMDANTGQVAGPEIIHASSQPGQSVPTHHPAVRTLDFSPDSRLLASAAGSQVTVCRVPDGQPVFPSLKVPDVVLDVAFNPVGDVLAVASTDNAARFYRVASGEQIGGPLRHAWGSIYQVAFHPHNGRAATFGEDGQVRIWRWRDRNPIGAYYVHQRAITGGFLEEGRTLLGVGDSTSFWLRDIDNADPNTVVRNHSDALTFAVIHPDGHSFAIGCRDGTLATWPVPPVEPINKQRAHRDEITQLAYHPDGNWLASASLDGRARVWQGNSGRAASPSLPHGSPVNSLAFDPLGHRLASATRDGVVRLWRFPAGRDEPQASANLFYERMLTVDSPSGRALHISGSVWDVNTRAALGNIGEHEKTFTADFIPGQPEVMVLNPGGRLLIHDYTNGKSRPPPWSVASVAFLPVFSGDGQRVAVVTWEPRVRVFDASNAGLIWESAELEFLPTCSAMNDEGTKLILGDDSGGLALWDVPTGNWRRLSATLPEAVDRVTLLSAKGDWVFASGGEGHCLLLRLEDPTAHPINLVHARAVLRAAINSNETHLATLSADGSAHLWRVHGGEHVSTPLTHGRSSADAAGRRIIGIEFDVVDDNLVTIDRYFRKRRWDVFTAQPLSPPPDYADWQTNRTDKFQSANQKEQLIRATAGFLINTNGALENYSTAELQNFWRAITIE